MSKISTEQAEYLENLKNMTKAKGFLGREFLTWLWYRIDSDEGQFKLPSPFSKKTIDVRVWIDDRVVLEASTQQTHSHTLKGGDPARSPEASASLRSGKTVREFKIGVEIDGYGPFTAILTSDGTSSNGLSPRSLNIPKYEDDSEEVKEPIAYRLDQMQRFLDVLDGLFAAFLDDRMSERWEKTELQKLRSWVKERRLDGEAPLH